MNTPEQLLTRGKKNLDELLLESKKGAIEEFIFSKTLATRRRVNLHTRLTSNMKPQTVDTLVNSLRENINYIDPPLHKQLAKTMLMTLVFPVILLSSFESITKLSNSFVSLGLLIGYLFLMKKLWSDSVDSKTAIKDKQLVRDLHFANSLAKAGLSRTSGWHEVEGLRKQVTTLAYNVNRVDVLYAADGVFPGGSGRQQFGIYRARFVHSYADKYENEKIVSMKIKSIVFAELSNAPSLIIYSDKELIPKSLLKNKDLHYSPAYRKFSKKFGVLCDQLEAAKFFTPEFVERLTESLLQFDDVNVEMNNIGYAIITFGENIFMDKRIEGMSLRRYLAEIDSIKPFSDNYENALSILKMIGSHEF